MFRPFPGRNPSLAGAVSQAIQKFTGNSPQNISSDMARFRKGRKRSRSSNVISNKRRRVGFTVRHNPYSKGVTSQHDTAVVYRKKTMPRYKKRAWKSFVRKVNAVNERENGVMRVLFNDGTTFGATTSGTFKENSQDYQARSQDIVACHLYGGTKGNGDLTDYNQGINDLATVMQYFGCEGGATGSTAGGQADTLITFANTTKIKFISACLDITFTNTSSVPLEVDAYHIVYRKDWNNNLVGNAMVGNSTYNEYFDQYSLEEQQLRTAAGTANNRRLRLKHRGATPFEFGSAIGVMGAKIVKKTKHFVSPANSFTQQLRDPKTHYIDRHKFESGSGGATLKGLTQTILFIIKCTNTDSVVSPISYSYNLGCTRIYKYQRNGYTEDASTLVGGVNV